MTTFRDAASTADAAASRDVPLSPEVRQESIVAWLKENWPGLVVAFAVTLIAWLAVHPALRMLSDEANLVGTSKNFFASRTATFTGRAKPT